MKIGALYHPETEARTSTPFTGFSAKRFRPVVYGGIDRYQKPLDPRSRGFSLFGFSRIFDLETKPFRHEEPG